MEARRYTPSYTVADYDRWEGHWELWEGHPIAISPSPGVVHQRIVRRLTLQLDARLREAGCGCEVFFELDWRIDSGTVVRPDISVCCSDLNGEWITKPPRLIIEVLSPSTAIKDRTAKRSLYEEQGVGLYMLIDPETRSVEILQRDQAGLFGTLPADGPFDLGDGCRVQLDFESLWD